MISVSKSVPFLFILSLAPYANSSPFRIPETRPTYLASQTVIRDVRTIEKVNVKDNLIQSAEDGINVNCEISEGYSKDQLKGDKNTEDSEQLVFYNAVPPPRKVAYQKDEFPEGKNNLNKFYRNGQRGITQSDSIIFPSSKSEQTKPEVDNKEESEPRYSSYGYSEEPQLASIDPRISLIPAGEGNGQLERILSDVPTSSSPFFSPEQDQLSYDILLQILRSILLRPKQTEKAASSRQTNMRNLEREEKEILEFISEEITDDTETTTIIPNTDQVDFHSLYSGPKLKTTCPPGQHRTHNGVCQEMSRKLTNVRG